MKINPVANVRLYECGQMGKTIISWGLFELLYVSLSLKTKFVALLLEKHVQLSTFEIKTDETRDKVLLFIGKDITG